MKCRGQDGHGEAVERADGVAQPTQQTLSHREEPFTTFSGNPARGSFADDGHDRRPFGGGSRHTGFGTKASEVPCTQVVLLLLLAQLFRGDRRGCAFGHEMWPQAVDHLEMWTQPVRTRKGSTATSDGTVGRPGERSLVGGGVQQDPRCCGALTRTAPGRTSSSCSRAGRSGNTTSTRPGVGGVHSTAGLKSGSQRGWRRRNFGCWLPGRERQVDHGELGTSQAARHGLVTCGDDKGVPGSDVRGRARSTRPRSVDSIPQPLEGAWYHRDEDGGTGFAHAHMPGGPEGGARKPLTSVGRCGLMKRTSRPLATRPGSPSLPLSRPYNGAYARTMYGLCHYQQDARIQENIWWHTWLNIGGAEMQRKSMNSEETF
eukprot:scaffold4179_cov108-Isochrysis_galbana.AAC.3